MEKTLNTPKFRELGRSGVFVADGPVSYKDSLRAVCREGLELITIEELPKVSKILGPEGREKLFDQTFFCSNSIVNHEGGLRRPGVLPMTDWYLSPREAFSALFSARRRREVTGVYDNFVLFFRCSINDDEVTKAVGARFWVSPMMDYSNKSACSIIGIDPVKIGSRGILRPISI